MANKSQLAAKLISFVAVFVLLFAGFALLAWRTLDQVRVGGPLYDQIMLGNRLIADVLPPPQFIIEPYLLSLELRDETDTAAIARLIEKGNALRIQYENGQEQWKRDLKRDALGDLMTVTSYRAAMEFFRLRDDEYIPALRAGDRDRAVAVLEQMGQRFEAHRYAIDEVWKLADQRNQEAEAQAEALVQMQSQLLALLAIGVVLVVVIMAWFARKTAATLSRRVLLVSELADRVARGDLQVDVDGDGSRGAAGLSGDRRRARITTKLAVCCDRSTA